MNRPTLYPDQAKALDDLYSSLRNGHKRPLVMAVTAFGKTIFSTEIIIRALEKGKRVAFVVPALSLIDQTVRVFYKHGITQVGVIQGDHHMTDWSKPVQVCSAQTINRRGYPNVDLVLIDECHTLHKSIRRWMKDKPELIFVGLSATPYSKGLGLYFDDLVKTVSMSDLIKSGRLCDFEMFAPDEPDVSKVKVSSTGDLDEEQHAAVMDTPPLVANIVENWIRNGEDRNTLCFGVNRKHARHIQEQFESANIPCGYIDAFTPAKEREEILDALEARELRAVSNVGTLTTGVDRDIRCIILARHIRSKILYQQIVGRGLRLALGKDHCLIFDHSSTFSTLGFVTDIGINKLSTTEKSDQPSEKENKAPKPKKCPKCNHIREAKVPICPKCGFKPEPQSDIAHEEGALKKIDKHGNEVKNAPSNVVKMRGKDINHKDFYSQLLGYEQAKNYKQGWAANQFNKKIGKFPNEYRSVTPSKPCGEVMSWIKSQQIRYAMGKKKARSS